MLGRLTDGAVYRLFSALNDSPESTNPLRSVEKAFIRGTINPDDMNEIISKMMPAKPEHN